MMLLLMLMVLFHIGSVSVFPLRLYVVKFAQYFGKLAQQILCKNDAFSY